MNWSIVISPRAAKQIKRLPKYIVVNLLDWVVEVETYGLETVRKVPGYHDEPLKGEGLGYCSIRLNKSYRAIYRVEEGQVRLAIVIEVNNHEY